MATVVVVGAGIAGLSCGQALRHAGHQVIWLEKSRGVGGRMATRRLGQGAWADHGLRHWPLAEPSLQPLTQELIAAGHLLPWSAQGFVWTGTLVAQPGVVYCAEGGVNAIAKYLATEANIQRQQRVIALEQAQTGWQLTTVDAKQDIHPIRADAVVLAIPAPQARALLKPLDTDTATALTSVDYAPCLSLMATYKALPHGPNLDPQQGWHITADHPTIAWISLDSSKRQHCSGPQTIVIQSQTDFAAQYLQQLDSAQPHEHDRLRHSTITKLFTAAAKIVPGLENAQTQQLQRWRYSTVNTPYTGPFFATPWPTLIGCGDWCAPSTTVSNLAAAYTSGRAAAHHILTTV